MKQLSDSEYRKLDGSEPTARLAVLVLVALSAAVLGFLGLWTALFAYA
ncbi:MAG: hypothetical protein MK171_12195 [Pirellulales bacterium]|nr:hypothetical protein [Pirellulales bacterium]